MEHDRPPLPSRKRQNASDYIRRSREELQSGNAEFFARLLPTDQHWRLFADFRDSVAYLDIETSGDVANVITTIAIYDGSRIKWYVRGRNLSTFADDILRYKLLVTYSGKVFDVPVIERSFGLRLRMSHIDLRYVLKSLGYAGGLKGCEKQLGIDRGVLDGLNGYWAVLLWRDYIASGNEGALETLLAYNIEDVVNLETLMVQAYNMKLRHTPFAESHRFALPRPPTSPFKVDYSTVEKIRNRYFSR